MLNGTGANGLRTDGVRVGLRVPPCAPPAKVADFIRRVERCGFDDVWLPDSQTLWREVFTTLAVVATSTDTIRLGTAVTNVVTRHPSVVASAARTLAEAAEGRFVLGVGVGNSAVHPSGLRPSTNATLREGIRELRESAPGISVHLAASGPRNLATAGEVADGVILLAGAEPAMVAAALKHVRGTRGELPREVTVSAFCHVTSDVANAARELKPICATLASTGGASSLRKAGIEIDVPARVPEVRPDLRHARDWDHAVEVCSRWVSDDDALRFAESFCLYGTVEQISARLKRLAELGVTGVQLQHVGSYTFPEHLTAALSATDPTSCPTSSASHRARAAASCGSSRSR